MFDQRFDGQVDRTLLGVCRPASEIVTILSVTKSENHTVGVTQVGTHPAVSVASMRIMRSNIDDLLVVEPTGALTILTHGVQKYNASTVGITGVVPHFHSSVHHPNSAAPMEVDDASTHLLSNRVVALRDPIRSAVTIELLDRSISRATIDFIPKDLLTKQCLEVLALTLPSDWSFGLHVTFTDAWRSRRLSCNPGTEFECFKSALLTVLEIEPYQKDQARNLNPWDRLAGSTSFHRLEDDIALSCLQLPQRPSLKVPPPRKRPHPLLAPVLNGLHMLGEDLRLMVHRHEEVHRLAGLICLIASIIRPEWADYWKRFCPNVTSDWVNGTHHPAGSAEFFVSHGLGSSFVDDRLPVWPPDMTAMFYGRINNPDWKLPWYDIRKLSSQFKLSPSYAYGRLEPLAYLRQLTLIYRCLADKTVEDSRKRAENAMHVMVSHQIGSTFLNVIPLGLAAPLREAARTCQLAPGQDWPANAYEFIGRNDLAEGASANPGLLNTNGYRVTKEFLVSSLAGGCKTRLNTFFFRETVNDRAYHH
jgi:anaphase-promoting complex subunit 1